MSTSSLFRFFPNLPLTEDQREAVSSLEIFLNSQDAQVFILQGYAGTGKTTLMEGVVNFLLSEERKVYLMTPTGRSARILGEKTGVEARTIHSWIYKKELEVSSEEDFVTTFRLTEKKPDDGAILIVDEASMISNTSDSEAKDADVYYGSGRLLNDLFSFVNLRENSGSKIIFIGDGAQLLPVKDDFSLALDAAYITRQYNVEVSGAKLKNVARHSNGILKMATHYRQKIASGNFSDSYPINAPDTKIVNHNSLIDSYFECVRDIQDTDDNVLIVAAHNKALDYNLNIRRKLLQTTSENILPLERLMIVQNHYSTSGESLMNGDIVTVETVGAAIIRKQKLKIKLNSYITESSVIRKIDINEIEVTLNFRELSVKTIDNIVMNIIVLEHFPFNEEKSFEREVRRALRVDLIRRLKNLYPGLNKMEFDRIFNTAEMSDPYYNAVAVKFGYAIICHKAQGGEWEHVFANICTRPQNSGTEAYFRWIYTAFTRAKSKLTIGVPFVKKSYSSYEYSVSNLTIFKF